MTILSQTYHFTNGTANNGTEVDAEFGAVYTGVNAHIASSPADHADGSITVDLLASNAVTNVKILADAVNGSKIADDSIDSEHYVDGSIDTAHIADAQITIGKCYAGVSGWHGSKVGIKILPRDFVGNVNTAANTLTDNGQKLQGSNYLTATVPIPTGYTATTVTVYGSDTANEVEVYECTITGSSPVLKSPAGQTVGDIINITDVESTTSNYLAIVVDTDGYTDDIYGGYVIITPTT